MGVTVIRGSKEHRGCLLEIVEERLTIKIDCEEKRRLRKPQAISYEESIWNVRSRRGSEVIIGDISLLFPSDEEACTLIRKALSISYGRIFEKILGAVTNYLKKRSEILMLLKRLATSPRSTLISMASQVMSCESDPFDCALERIKKELSDLYKRFLNESLDILSTAPHDLVNSVSTLVNTIKELQVKIIENRGEEVKRIIEHIEREIGYTIDKARVEKLQIDLSGDELKRLSEEIASVWINRLVTSINNRFLC